MARRVSRWVLAAALGAIAPARTALAADGPAPRVSLRWTAPAGCPGPERVLGEVDRLLGDVGARPPTPLEVVATVTPDPSGKLRVHLETKGQGAQGTRELEASTCDALADATALILALIIDPNAALAAPPPEAPKPAPPPPPPSPPAPASPAPASPAPARAPSTPSASAARPRLVPHFGAAIWAAGDVGSLPGAGLGLAGAGVVTLAGFRFELGATGFPRRRAVIAQRPSTGGDVSLVVGSTSLCYDVLPPGAFELSPCLGVEVGRLHASGFGVSSPGEGSGIWSAARAGGLFGWRPLRLLLVSLRVEAAVPFGRPTFVLENVGDVFRPGPVAGRAGLGLELRW